jgi:putative hydrolase of the HAD superfamily
VTERPELAAPTDAPLAGIRMVFFDIGGTLAYPHPSFNGLIAQVCQANGLEVTADQTGRVEPIVWQHIARRKDAGRGFSLSTDDSREFWLWVYRTYLTEMGHPSAAEGDLPYELLTTFMRTDSYRLYDDVIPTLRKLRDAGFPMGVISNWEAWLDRLLVDLTIHEYFDVMVVSGTVGIEKPDPQIFRMALGEAGVRPEESVHVGDSPAHDVAGAEAVGIRGILLDRDDRFAPVFPKPIGAGDEDEAVVSTGGPNPEVHVAHRVRNLLEIPDLLGAP